YFSQAENPILIADEVHRLGSTTNRIILQLNFKEKLGLSATPERLFDQEGDEALKAVFGCTPIYDLPLSGKVKLSRNDDKEIPILGKFLSYYDYDFEIVNLTEEEQNQWNKITSEIARIIPLRLKQNEDFKFTNDKKLLNLFIR